MWYQMYEAEYCFKHFKLVFCYYRKKNYLQLLSRELIVRLLYQGFPESICLEKNSNWSREPGKLYYLIIPWGAREL